MTSEYHIEDARDSSEFATGTSVLVAYDYHNKRSIPIPEEWRKTILQLEGTLEQK
jgi:acyl-CoA thioesterase FadM